MKKAKEDTNKIYAALKLIQHLYKSGKVKEYVYRNILKEYREYVDISDFLWYNTNILNKEIKEVYHG